MISIYDYFSRSYIYPWMDPVNTQYIKNVVFVKANYFGKNIYFFYTKLQSWIQDNQDIWIDSMKTIIKRCGGVGCPLKY